MLLSVSRSAATGRAILIGLVTLLLFEGCWTPKMVHPYIYESGRLLEARRVEIGGQFFPAGTVAVGLGKGVAVRGSYGYVGDDILGSALELTRSLYSRDPFHVSATVGGEWFEADENDFSGQRWFGGLAGSWYPGSGQFGVHFPLRAYKMSYDWGGDFDEWLGDHPDPESGEGVVFVPGIAFSIEDDHVAFRFGASSATVDYLDDINLLPYIGAQLAIRIGGTNKKAKPPTEF